VSLKKIASRSCAALVLAALATSACGNASSSNAPDGPAGSSAAGGPTGSVDLTQKVDLADVPGVTDDAISYSVIGPDCPECGMPLRTPRATICATCGWQT
jgi:hypothetical protein